MPAIGGAGCESARVCFAQRWTGGRIGNIDGKLESKANIWRGGARTVGRWTYHYAWSSDVANVSRLKRGKGIEIRATSGKVNIVGTQNNDVRVTIENVSAETARMALIKIDRNRNPMLIEIENLPQFATAYVEVPRAASVAVSMLAGELGIVDVDGDKLCLLRSEKMSIDAGDPETYKSVRAFVLAGDIHAPAFDRNTGGVGRMITWKGPGQTVIDAQVSAGSLVLQ